MNLERSLKKLIVSRARIKLLELFLTKPGDDYFVRELVRLSGEEINSVRREIQNLEEAGILKSEWRGNRRFYWLDTHHPLFNELLFLVKKSTGFGQKILKNRQRMGDIKYLLLTSRYLYSTPLATSPEIDFLIIGDAVLPEVGKMVREEEAKLGREINYTLLSEEDFKLRKRNRDSFVLHVLLDNYLLILGQEADFASV